MIEEIEESQCSLVEYCKLVNSQSTDISRDGQLPNSQFKSQNYQFSKILGNIIYRGKVCEGREIAIQRIDTFNQNIILKRFQAENWKITWDSLIVENGCQFIEYKEDVQLLIVTQCGQVNVYNFMRDEATLFQKLEGNNFQCLAQPRDNQIFFVFDCASQMVMLQLEENLKQINTTIIELNRFSINLRLVKDYFRVKSPWKQAFALTSQSILYYSREDQFQIVNIVNRKPQIIQLNYSQTIISKQILFFPYSNVKTNHLIGAIGTIVIVQDDNVIILQITIRDGLIKNNCNISDCNIQTINDASLNRIAILETPYDINRNQCDIILNNKTLFIIRDESIYYYHLIGQVDQEFKPLFTQIEGHETLIDYKGCLIMNEIPIIIYKNSLKTIITTTNAISEIQKRIEQQGYYYQMKIIQQHVNLMKFFQQYQFEFQKEEQSIQYLTVINLVFNTNKIYQHLKHSFYNHQYDIYGILQDIIMAEEETLVFVCETFKTINIQQVINELLQQLEMIVSSINKYPETVQKKGANDTKNNGIYQSYLIEIFYQQVYDHFKLFLHCIIGIGVLQLYNFEFIHFEFQPYILDAFKLLFCILASKNEIINELIGKLTFTTKLRDLVTQQLESDLELIVRVGLQKGTLKSALGKNIKIKNNIMMEALLNLNQPKISLLSELEEEGKVPEAVICLKKCKIQNTEEVLEEYLRNENYQEFKTNVGLRFLVSDSSYEVKYRIFKNAIKSSQFRLIFYFLLLFDLRLDENVEIGEFFQEYFFKGHGDNQIINHLSEYRFSRRVTQMIGDYIINRTRFIYQQQLLDVDQHLTVIMNQVAFLNKQSEVYQAIVLMMEFLYYIEKNSDANLLKYLQIQNNLLSYILEECSQIEDTSIYSTQFICYVNAEMFDLLNQNHALQELKDYNPMRTIVDLKQIKKLYQIKKAYFHALTKKGYFYIWEIFPVLICLEQYDQLIDLWRYWQDPSFEKNLSLIYIKLDRNKRDIFVHKILGVKEINQKQVLWVITELIIRNIPSIPLDTIFEMTNEKETIIEALLQFKRISMAQEYTTRYLKSLKNSEKQQFINYNLIARVIEYKTDNFEQLKQWVFDEKFLKE